MFKQLVTLTKCNKAAAHMRSLRLSDCSAMATDLVTTVWVNGLPIPRTVDCLVDSQKFLEVWSFHESPVVSQESKYLKFKEGRYSNKLPLIDTKTFPFKPTKPEGESIEIGNLLEVFTSMKSHLKSEAYITASSLLFLLGEHAYYTNGAILVRMPTGTKVPFMKALTKPFLQLVTAFEQELVDIVVTDKDFTVVFEDAWVSTRKPGTHTPPVDVVKFFADNQSGKYLNEQVGLLAELRKILAFTKSGDVVGFADTGAYVMREREVVLEVDVHFGFRAKIPADSLKEIISYNPIFGIESNKLCFRGEGIEGYLGVMP